jgi:PAS domain S-box-containing protein
VSETVNILLVDDHPANLVSLEAVLAELGHNLVTARSGQEALALVAERDFAVVLLEAQLAGLDGFETARLIRRQERSRHTPVIFLTTLDEGRSAVERAYSLGAVDYLVKPLIPVILRAKVAVFVELFQKTEQARRQAEHILRLEREELQGRLAEQGLREQRQRELLRVTLSGIADGVVMTDTVGRITFLNAAAEALTGWPPGEAEGEPLERVFRACREGTADLLENPALRAVLAEETVRPNAPMTLTARDGSRRAVEGSAAPIRDVDGRVRGAVLIFRDITARRRAVQAMQESEQRLRAIIDNWPAALFVKDAQGRYLMANRAFAPAVGRDADEVLGKTDFDFFPEDVARRLRADDEEVLRTGANVQYEETVPVHGCPRTFLTVKFPLAGAASTPYAVCGIATDMTDRKRAEEALKEADRRKDEFLAMLAHELRNPLAPIRNALQILREPGADSAAAEQAGAMIERQVQTMVRLVDDLLDVSRITRGKVRLRKEPVALAAVVSRAVESARPLIDANRHELSVRLPDEPAILEADPTRLEQVFANLLNNAAKYTERGGALQLHARVEGGEAEVRVRDSGFGIPPEVLPHVFDLFAQAERTLDRSQGGLGIGLTLVRSLVELHGGRVSAQSEGPGKGSEFVVRLPLLAGPVAPPEAADRPEAPAAQAGRPLRVLVVDDNKDIADSLAFLVRLWGHDVRTSHDGQSALKAARTYRPRVVLLDIGLPGLTGYEVARELRADSGSDEVMLVAITGYGQEEDRRRSRQAGFDLHWVKPVDPAALQRLLAALGAVGQG